MSIWIIPLFLHHFFRDEGLSGYVPDDVIWHLTELAGAPAPKGITLEIERDQIHGQAPCNRYSAQQSAPYPWFEPGPIAATRMACKDLETEQLYLEQLSKMTLAEVSGDILILSTPDGPRLVFHAGK